MKAIKFGLQVIFMNKGFLLLLLALAFLQCSKEEVAGDTNIPADLTTLSQGSFQSAAHSTSGTVKLAQDPQGKKYLVFENFKTDSGPDVRIWLAVDKTAQDYTELSKTVPSGNFKIDVPASTDTNKQKYVLIWCKQFTVLFGSAQLK